MLLKDNITLESLDESVEFRGSHAEKEAVFGYATLKQDIDGPDVARRLVGRKTCPIPP